MVWIVLAIVFVVALVAFFFVGAPLTGDPEGRGGALGWEIMAGALVLGVLDMLAAVVYGLWRWLR